MFMPHPFSVAIVGGLLVSQLVAAQSLPGRRPNVPDDHPIHAAWSFENGPLLRLYDRSVDCPEPEAFSEPVLMFVATREVKGDDVGYFVRAELPLCSVILPDRSVLLCRAGEVRVVAAADDELRGDYALTLSDGQLRQGRFRARHCPRKNP